MAPPKTRPTTASVDAFIDSLSADQVRDDCRRLVRIMAKATGCPPEMWGTSIIGFGRHWWTGAGGKKREWMLAAFSPRKTSLTVYLWSRFDGWEELLDRLGKHSCGQGCLYITRLADVHVPTLERLIVQSVKAARANVNGEAESSGQ